MKKQSQLFQMQKVSFKTISTLVIALSASLAFAKLPAPTDEAKAKAAETAAKSAWSGKVDGYLLCKTQDKTAAHYRKTAANAKAAVATPPCSDPGAFVMPDPAAVAAPAPAAPAVAAPAAAPAPAAPAAAAAPAKKS